MLKSLGLPELKHEIYLLWSFGAAAVPGLHIHGGFWGILEGSSGISVILVVPSMTRVTPAGSGTTSQSKKLLILCTNLNLLSICAVPEGAFTAGFAGLGNPSTAGTQGGCEEAFPGHCDNLCSWNSWKGGEKVQEVQRDSGVCSAMNET